MIKNAKNINVVNKSLMTGHSYASHNETVGLNAFSIVRKEGCRDFFLIVSQPPLIKPDVVISPVALAYSWIWLQAQTRDLHVCLRGFSSDTGFLPQHKDMQAGFTCKSLFPRGECHWALIMISWKTNARNANQNVWKSIWSKTCLVCNEFLLEGS